MFWAKGTVLHIIGCCLDLDVCAVFGTAAEESYQRMDGKISSSFLTECFRFYDDKLNELKLKIYSLKYKWLTNSEITAAFTYLLYLFTYFLGSEVMKMPFFFVCFLTFH